MITIEQLTAIVREASKLMVIDGFEIEQKAGCENIVTSSDVAVQNFLCKRLAEALPGSGFLCEEKDVYDVAHKYTWIIDPIDGTANYSRGIDQCAICVGLVKREERKVKSEESSLSEERRVKREESSLSEEGRMKSEEPKVGGRRESQFNSSSTERQDDSSFFTLHSSLIMAVVFLPRTNELFHAERGKGAFLNGRRIHVSDRPFKNGVLCTALPVYYKEHAEVCSRIILETFGKCNDVRRFGAAAPELCYLAMGRIELYFEYRLSPWDYAAASLILTEAGGIITSLQGEAIDLTRPCGVVAANTKESHGQLREIVERHVSETI